MATDGLVAGTNNTPGPNVNLVTSGVRATGKRAAGVRALGDERMERDRQVQR